VLKQMRLIHTKGFSIQERKQWKVTIFQNLLHAFQVVFGAMEEQEVDFAESGNIVGLELFYMLTIRPATETDINRQRFAEIVAADPEIGPEEPMPLDCLHAFKSLWRDEGIQMAIRKGNEYALHDNLT
jgi:guanine nucleotide-binding protein subunit alpha